MLEMAVTSRLANLYPSRTFELQDDFSNFHIVPKVAVHRGSEEPWRILVEARSDTSIVNWWWQTNRLKNGLDVTSNWFDSLTLTARENQEWLGRTLGDRLRRSCHAINQPSPRWGNGFLQFTPRFERRRAANELRPVRCFSANSRGGDVAR